MIGAVALHKSAAGVAKLQHASHCGDFAASFHPSDFIS